MNKAQVDSDAHDNSFRGRTDWAFPQGQESGESRYLASWMRCAECLPRATF